MINDSSLSLSGTNFGFTTFSVAAIKLKPSLVFRIFVKQGRQTLSESEAFFFSHDDSRLCSACAKVVKSCRFLFDGINKFSVAMDCHEYL